MNYLLVVFSLLLFSPSSHSDPDTRKLSISVEEQVEIPADIIQFNINLNAESDNPEAAYRLHKQREKALVNLLEKYDIREENIHYQPVSIHQSRDYRQHEEEQTTYQTRQSVSLLIKDFEIYEQLQIGLIESGFDSFSGTFMSSRADEGKNQALRKAIQTAKDKAQLIADEAGLQVGKILQINYSQNHYRPVYSNQEMYMAKSADNLLEYEQTVKISASVSIDFALLDE